MTMIQVNERSRHWNYRQSFGVGRRRAMYRGGGFVVDGNLLFREGKGHRAEHGVGTWRLEARDEARDFLKVPDIFRECCCLLSSCW